MRCDKTGQCDGKKRTFIAQETDFVIVRAIKKDKENQWEPGTQQTVFC